MVNTQMFPKGSRHGIAMIAARSLNPSVWAQIQNSIKSDSDEIRDTPANAVLLDEIDRSVNSAQLLEIGTEEFISSPWEAVLVIPYTETATFFEAWVIFDPLHPSLDPETFKIAGSEIPDFIVNITLGNLEIMDYFRSVDGNGIFTGFPEVRYHPSQVVSPDELRAIADRWNIPLG